MSDSIPFGSSAVWFRLSRITIFSMIQRLLPHSVIPKQIYQIRLLMVSTGRLKGENYSSPLVEERSVKVSLYSAQAFQNDEKGFMMRFGGRISPIDALIRVFRTVLRFLK